MHWYVSGLAASLLEALVGIIDQAVADKWQSGVLPDSRSATCTKRSHQVQQDCQEGWQHTRRGTEKQT